MDIRDILKSFDSLSEAKTTTDKGTVHKAGPGGYGNRHGSDDVTDQYGKPKGKVSLSSLGPKDDKPKQKGRPVDPDRPKLGKDDPKNKKIGDLFGRTTGAVPKGKKGTTISGKAQSHSDNKKDDGTGDEETTSKKSLKEYFDQMDEALYEAALAVQPLPATPQQKQQQQMATKPSFMIKDPANPNMPAITTQDPAVVQAAKNGTMTMQKPGATPAAGAGSQVAPMKEGGDVGKHNNATTGFDALVRKLTPKYGKEAATKIAGAQLKKMSEAEQPQHFAQSSPLSTANRGVLEGEGDFGKAIEQLSGWDEVEPYEPGTRQYDFDDDEGGYYAQGTVVQDLKTGQIKIEFKDDGEYGGHEINDTFNSIGDAMNALRNITTRRSKSGKSYSRDSLAAKSLAGPDDVYKTDRAGKIGTLTKSRMGNMKASSQSTMRGGPKGVLPEGKKGANPFAKKEETDKKKCPPMSHIKKMCQDGKSVAEICKMHPDCDQKELKQMVADCKKTLDEASMPMKKVDGKSVPAFAADGKGKNDLKKETDINSKRKKQVDAAGKAFSDSAEYKKSGGSSKTKVKEGMDSKLQAARLRGKSHALSKEAYNCHYDDMEEARCYHEGFKEGLDECYGQMPILGRTRVGEMGQGPEVATMASYGADGMGEAMYDEGADELGEMDKTSYMKQQAIKTPGDTFKAFGQTMRDSNVLDEFAFEALDKQLNAILEGKEVSEGMTVSISKGQQGSPDSVSVSAQDGEADQLLSIIKSAGMGLFGGEDKGYGSQEGSAGAHGGISVVDDHDGMMALMKKLSGGGEMQGGGDYEDEEGHEGHGEEEHMRGHEKTCESCGGMMEAGHSCGSKEMVDEVESEDQMLYNVAEDNPPDSGADNTNADVADQVGSDKALATADAAQDMATAKTYSNPTEGKEDTTGEEAGKKKEEETVAESFANLYKKLAFLSEESTSEKDEKAEKAGKKVANDIEDDEGHKGKDDNKAEKAGKKVTKDIEYDDKKDEKYKKDKKVDESYANSADDTFEADIDFMTKVISGGLNKQKSTGQTTIPVINGQKSRMGVDGLGNPLKESTDLLKDYMKLSGL